MKKIFSILLFQSKLLKTSLPSSLSIGFLADAFLNSLNPTPLSKINSSISFTSVFLLIHIAFHIFNYELNRKNEIYFYYNQGISKSTLWVSSILICLLINALISYIWIFYM